MKHRANTGQPGHEKNDAYTMYLHAGLADAGLEFADLYDIQVIVTPQSDEAMRQESPRALDESPLGHTAMTGTTELPATA